MADTGSTHFWIDPAQLLAISKLRRRSTNVSSGATAQLPASQPETAVSNSANENIKNENIPATAKEDRVDIAAKRIKRMRMEIEAANEDDVTKKRSLPSVSPVLQIPSEVTVSRFEVMVDRSLKSYLRIVTNMQNVSVPSGGYERAAALSHYVQAAKGKVNCDLPARLLASVFNWRWPCRLADEHSGIFRFEKLDSAMHSLSSVNMNSQDASVLPKSKAEDSDDEFSEFSEALTSLFGLFEHGCCTDFYMLASSFSVHFGTTQGDNRKFAVISPSTIGLRDALQRHRVEFRAAFDLVTPVHLAPVATADECSSSVSARCAEDADMNSFLRQLNVDLTQFPELRRTVTRSSTLPSVPSALEVDGKLDSTLLVSDDASLVGLLRFLTTPQNQRFFCKHAQRAAPFAAVLLSDTPFCGASLCKLDCVQHTVPEGTNLRTTIEVSGGPILPSTVQRLVAVLKEATESCAAGTTAAFSVHMRTDSRSVGFNYTETTRSLQESMPFSITLLDDQPMAISTRSANDKLATRITTLPSCISNFEYRKDALVFTLR